MSSPFSAHEPWRRQQPDYAESATANFVTPVRKESLRRWTRHNPGPGMLTEIVKAYLPRFGQFEQAIENAVPEMVAI